MNFVKVANTIPHYNSQQVKKLENTLNYLRDKHIIYKSLTFQEALYLRLALYERKKELNLL